jgi:hypothetical protein
LVFLGDGKFAGATGGLELEALGEVVGARGAKPVGIETRAFGYWPEMFLAVADGETDAEINVARCD